MLLLALLGVGRWRRIAFGRRAGARPVLYGATPFCFSLLRSCPVGTIVAVYMDTGRTPITRAALFQGGAVLAVMWILVMIAGLQDVPPISRRRMRLAAGHRPRLLSPSDFRASRSRVLFSATRQATPSL